VKPRCSVVAILEKQQKTLKEGLGRFYRGMVSSEMTGLRKCGIYTQIFHRQRKITGEKFGRESKMDAGVRVHRGDAGENLATGFFSEERGK